VRRVKSTASDIGEFLPCIGRLFRVFNPKEPNYYDSLVDSYIRSIGEDPSVLNRYVVTPKRLGQSINALKRYDRAAQPFSPEICCLYDVAGEWLDKEFGLYVGNSIVVDYDDCLEWFNPMKSPGYPWSLSYTFKADFWMSPDVDFFAKYYDVLSTPDYIRSLCSVSIKEEIRPREKVDNDKVRTIIAMDVNHVTASARLSLDHNRKLTATHLKHSGALGMNLFEGGMHRLNDRMSAFGGGPNTIELDGVQFDGRYREYCFDKIAAFRWRMLAPEYRTPENKARLINLYKELTRSPLVNVDGHVYGRVTGGPSGHGNTTPDNLYKNFMDMVVLWHRIMPKDYHTYEKFHEFLVLCICGDDINETAHPSIQCHWNVAAIRKHAASIDMEYTFASEDYRHNSECTFLGHGFQLTDIPSLGHAMYLPIIDCERMRTNMLIYNIAQTPEMTIIRACGLRNETFACSSCRKWFSDLLDYLRVLVPLTPKVLEAWKNYKTDADLWKLFSGFDPVDLSL